LPGGDGNYVDGDTNYRKAVVLIAVYLLDVIFPARHQMGYAVFECYEAHGTIHACV
jgi:hypothetical protein